MESADLNTAFSKEGAFIHIPKNKLCRKADSDYSLSVAATKAP